MASLGHGKPVGLRIPTQPCSAQPSDEIHATRLRLRIGLQPGGAHALQLGCGARSGGVQFIALHFFLPTSPQTVPHLPGPRPVASLGLPNPGNACGPADLLNADYRADIGATRKPCVKAWPERCMDIGSWHGPRKADQEPRPLSWAPHKQVSTASVHDSDEPSRDR